MNIAIIDDHVLIGDALKNTIKAQMENVDIKSFKSGDDFMAYGFTEWKPHLVVSDIVMPGMNGLTVYELCQRMFANTCKFILLSSFYDVHSVKDAMRRGVHGYVGKNSSLDEVLDAIKAVMAGEIYVSKTISKELQKHIFSEDEVVFHLSPREKMVLESICAGQTPKEIAFDNNLSVHTVQEYLKSVMRKFKVNRTTDLVLFAIQKGLYIPQK